LLVDIDVLQSKRANIVIIKFNKQSTFWVYESGHQTHVQLSKKSQLIMWPRCVTTASLSVQTNLRNTF